MTHVCAVPSTTTLLREEERGIRALRDAEENIHSLRCTQVAQRYTPPEITKRSMQRSTSKQSTAQRSKETSVETRRGATYKGQMRCEVLTGVEALRDRGGLDEIAFTDVTGDVRIEIFHQVLPLRSHSWGRTGCRSAGDQGADPGGAAARRSGELRCRSAQRDFSRHLLAVRELSGGRGSHLPPRRQASHLGTCSTRGGRAA